MSYQAETPIWLYHNLFIIYFNGSFLINVRADRFQKPWLAVECVAIMSYFLLYVFRDIILIQLHLYNNTRWFSLWLINQCHHSLHVTLAVWLSLLTYIYMGTYRKTKLYYMIMCLRLKLIPGHGVVVQSILSIPLPLHEPPWQERLLVDPPTSHVFEQVVHCDHCVQVAGTRLYECIQYI
jgi:hypothetical protein